MPKGDDTETKKEVSGIKKNQHHSGWKVVNFYFSTCVIHWEHCLICREKLGYKHLVILVGLGTLDEMGLFFPGKLSYFIQSVLSETGYLKTQLFTNYLLQHQIHVGKSSNI